MITALDTKGNVYLSLVQSNTNVKIMDIFFQHLVKKLDSENPRWRNTTVVLLDNASYHTSKAAFEIYKKHRIKTIFTGPYSYNAAPVELFFAAFKADDINPRKVKTGKR